MNLSASIYAADPLNIENSLLSVVSQVESFHFDVMDGHYTAAYGLNLALFNRVKAFSHKPIDVHLMVNNPDDWAVKFALMGARWVAVHPECCPDPLHTIKTIQKAGSGAYLAFSLAIQPEEYKSLFHHIDGVLLLSAPAGGGDFDISAFDKISQIPDNLPIAFDGKITPARFPYMRNHRGDLSIMGAAFWS